MNTSCHTKIRTSIQPAAVPNAVLSQIRKLGFPILVARPHHMFHRRKEDQMILQRFRTIQESSTTQYPQNQFNQFLSEPNHRISKLPTKLNGKRQKSQEINSLELGKPILPKLLSHRKVSYSQRKQRQYKSEIPKPKIVLLNNQLITFYKKPGGTGMKRD